MSDQVKIPRSARAVLQAVGEFAARLGTPAYAVGGCVRDWCLGRPGRDLDIAVEGDGIALARAWAAAWPGALTVHEQFGTAAVIRPRGTPRRADFAMCRRETYAAPAAYPRVTPGRLEDDLFRRDFTINAMALALSPDAFGTVVDPFGGRRDLAGRWLRVLHPRSFRDDPSRILRGVRFAARFHLRWELRTRAALREAVAEGWLGRLNAGRVRRELEYMLDEPDPRACLRELAGILKG